MDYKKYVREKEYMSGVERDKCRVKQTAEVFTPTLLVQEILDKLEEQDPTIFSDPTKTFLDNSCGDCQFLSEIIIRKMEKSGCDLLLALSTTYGVDMMVDTVIECKKRLSGPNPSPEILEIVNKNIVCHDALTYDYNFGEEPPPMECTVKVCRDCKIEKSIDEFEKNQVGKNNRVVRRPVCKECRSVKLKINPKQKRKYDLVKPKIGEHFECPICGDSFIRKFKNDVVLDHSHIDGSVRGLVCGNCNTGLGRFKDNVDILKKAIEWLNK